MKLGTLATVTDLGFWGYPQLDGFHLRGLAIELPEGSPLVLIDRRGGFADPQNYWSLRFLTPLGPLWCRPAYAANHVRVVKW